MKLVKGEATGSAPGVSEREGPARAFDGSRHTKYCVRGSTMWVQIKLANGPQRIESYAIMSAKDGGDRDPKDWTLKGSRDGENWHVVDRRTGEDFGSRCERREFRAAQPGEYGYYRLEVTRNHGADLTQFSELYLIHIDK